MSWQVTVLTLFPEMFPGPLGESLSGKALADGIWRLDTVNIRDYATDRHATVDDRPFGGGAGMVMRPDIVAAALDAAFAKPAKLKKIFYLSPRGRVFTQNDAREWAACQHIALLCGRYEGIDQRVIDAYGIEEISIGDYVLSGGEIAAMAVIDACVRQLSGVLGNEVSSAEESFGSGGFRNLLEYPHYTRPAEWSGRSVPAVLLSGDHAAVERWRLEQAEEITRQRRADLWERRQVELAGQEGGGKRLATKN